MGKKDDGLATVATVRASSEIDTTMNSISMVDVERLTALESFEEAAKFIAQSNDGIVTVAEEMGDGTELFNGDEKAKLVGVALILAEWKFNDGENGRFVSIRAIARKDDGSVRHLIINDGSTGIMEQLAKYQKETQRVGGLVVPKGLRASRYEYAPATATQPAKWATTYYLNTSA